MEKPSHTVFVGQLLWFTSRRQAFSCCEVIRPRVKNVHDFSKSPPRFRSFSRSEDVTCWQEGGKHKEDSDPRVQCPKKETMMGSVFRLGGGGTQEERDPSS